MSHEISRPLGPLTVRRSLYFGPNDFCRAVCEKNISDAKRILNGRKTAELVLTKDESFYPLIHDSDDMLYCAFQKLLFTEKSTHLDIREKWKPIYQEIESAFKSDRLKFRMTICKLVDMILSN